MVVVMADEMVAKSADERAATKVDWWVVEMVVT